VKKILLTLFVISFVSAVLPAQGTYDNYLEQGDKHYEADEFDAAITNFEAAKRLRPGSPTVWKKLGDVYFMRGNYIEAINNYDRAIQIYTEIDLENPDAYNNRGEAYRSIGNYELAIMDFNKVIDLNKNLNKNDAVAWNNLGLAYYGKRDYDEAIKNFNNAIGIDKNYAPALNNRGAAYLEKGDYDMAVDDYTQLINLKVNYDYAIVYSNRGRAYANKKEYQKALADCDKALEINRNYAPAMNNRALAFLEMGEYQKALAAFKECLDMSEKSININDISVYAWFLAGMIYAKFPYLKGDIKDNSFWPEFGRLALDGIARGIKNAENIRQNFGTHGADLMAQMIYLYYAGVDLEAVLGSHENTFFYSESLRSRGFLEQLGTEAAIRLPGICKEDYKEFMRLRAVMKEQQDLIKTYGRAKLEAEAQEKHALAIKQYRDAEEALAELDRKLGSGIKKYTALRNPKPVTLNQAKDYCGEERAVLEYVLWDADTMYKPIKGYESWDLKGAAPAINSYCLVITKDGLTAVPLEPNFDYHNAINDLRDFITAEYTPLSKYEKARYDLYNQLIKPVMPYLKDIKYITIVPDGELAVIPFDVLRGDNYSKSFGDNYIISLSPSLSVSILARKENNMVYSPILFFANDEYFERENNFGGIWKDLGGVNDEIKELIEIASRQKKEYSSFFRENASKKQLLSVDTEIKKYSIIHFACHGYFDPRNPANSGLVLYQVSGDPVSEDGYLTIPEVAALELDARMVVLSACETGLGEAKIGEGMIGLARAFMVAGAGNVGVSLWEIDDMATVPFMKSLYQKVLEERKYFPEAYKEVKGMFKTGTFGARYERPRYWAPFTMYE